MELLVLFNTKGSCLSKIMGKLSVLFCLYILAVDFAVGVENSEKLPEVTFLTGEWPPFSSNSIEEYGVTTSIVSEACKRAGIKPIFKFVPWKRAFLNAKEGVNVATFPWYKTEEREKVLIYSDYHISESTNVVFYKKSDFPDDVQINELIDLIPYKVKIAGVRGYWYEKLFEKTLGNDFLIVDKSIQTWKLLENGRVKFVVEALDVGLYESQKFVPEIANDIAYATYNSETFYHYLLFSPSHKDTKWVKPKLDQALKSMHEDGTYQSYLRRKQ